MVHEYSSTGITRTMERLLENNTPQLEDLNLKKPDHHPEISALLEYNEKGRYQISFERYQMIRLFPGLQKG